MPLPPAPPPGGKKRPSSSDEGPAKTKPARNPVERGIVWGVIALLVIAGGMAVISDRGARRHYEASVENIRNAMRTADEARREVPVTELDGLVSGNPTREESEKGGITSRKLIWTSLVRSYDATVQWDETGSLMNFFTGKETE
ncbi:MAG: hypothetical protein IT428_09005 [Planctomycetaceae bacterium]|nr:hypothetical protein [Planctomycetaceae bacterium]